MSHYRGMDVTEHRIEVPLDHARPDGEKISVFAREISTDATLPWLLFLQGGPGGKSPRPGSLSGWLAEAVKHFRVLLLDQRGTGLSTRCAATSPPRPATWRTSARTRSCATPRPCASTWASTSGAPWARATAGSAP